MDGWLDVASIEELPPGSRRVIAMDGISVAVFNLDGEYFAIQNVCSHDGGDLTNGVVEEGEVIVCPRHGARFSIKTGAVLGPPAYEDIRTFSVRVAAGKIQVEKE